MNNLPFIILGLLFFLLLFAAAWWTCSSSYFITDPEVQTVTDILTKIAKNCGIDDELEVRRSNKFYTHDRSVIFVQIKDNKGKMLDNELVIRLAIHELAHRFNKDSAEHGISFYVHEKQFLQMALHLGYLSKEIPVNECYNWKETRNYSKNFVPLGSFDPNSIV